MVKENDVKGNKNSCSILFIIGNGFDLGMGMKTSYQDVYNTYIASPSNSATIRNFKKALSNQETYEMWSDFEIGMAEYAKSLSSEEELIECVRDFKQYMYLHLYDENQKVITYLQNPNNNLNAVREMNKSIGSFYIGQTPNVINTVEGIIGKEQPSYSYITFNYTTIFDTILRLRQSYQKIVEEDPLHIHGVLGNDIVLGVDNIEQLNGTPYQLSKKSTRAFVKTSFNEEFDKARCSQAKKLISESSIICTYGFSLGESDKMWVDLLIDWLMANPEHHLIIFQYDKTEYNRYNFDEIMDAEDQKKERLLERLNIQKKEVLNQIHIPIGYDIFNFSLEKISPQKRPVENGAR